jgi:hypothetical protein
MTDRLAEFFEIAWNSRSASANDLQAEYVDIQAVDSVFLNFLRDWTDPECFGAAPLVIRAHSTYRAAAQLVLSGQIPEAFMIIRGSLECALYANHIDVTPSAFEIWIQRGEGPEAKKRCMTEFSAKKVFASLRERHGGLGDAVGRLYDRTIDFGAHPNQAAVTSSLEVRENDAGVSYEHAYVTRDIGLLRLGARSLCQAGIMVLDILSIVFPKHAEARQIQTSLAPLKPRF